MLVTILWRLEGKPAAAGAAFDDVDPDAWYAQAVAWASGNALVEGYGGSVFGPGDPITREQLAAVLYRYVQWKGQKALPQGVQLERFQDAGQVSAWAKEAVDWAVASGLLQGRGDKTLAPKNSANRAELAAMLQRFLTQLAQPS